MHSGVGWRRQRSSGGGRSVEIKEDHIFFFLFFFLHSALQDKGPHRTHRGERCASLLPPSCWIHALPEDGELIDSLLSESCCCCSCRNRCTHFSWKLLSCFGPIQPASPSGWRAVPNAANRDWSSLPWPCTDWWLALWKKVGGSLMVSIINFVVITFMKAC